MKCATRANTHHGDRRSRAGVPLHAVARIETLFRAAVERGYCSHTFTSAPGPTCTDEHQSTVMVSTATSLLFKGQASEEEFPH